MIRFSWWWSISVLVLFMSGCASVPSSVSSDYKVPKNTGKGVVVLTTSLTGAETEAIPNLYLRGTTRTYSQMLPMWNGKLLETGKDAFPMRSLLKPNQSLPEGQAMGILHVLELPEGSYEFYDVGGQSTSGHIKSINRFSQPFMVRAGSVLYLGNFNIDYRPYDAVPRSQFTICNRQDRDLPLLKARYRHLALEPIHIGIANDKLETAKQ